MSRTATETRITKETSVSAEVNLDGAGRGEFATGIGFFDHMLDHLATHSLIDMTIKAEGDLGVDGHHTVEDVGLTLGKALSRALGERRGITRYGFASVPMNEALAEVSLDISNRPFCVFDGPALTGKIGEFDAELAEEFIRALANAAGLTLHVTVRRGSNLHHVAEAVFKALARALGQAAALDARRVGAPSTKGTL